MVTDAAIFTGLMTILLLPAPSQEEQNPAEAWILKLDDDDLETREKAATELVRMGTRAEPFLRKALESSEPEIRGRVRNILTRIQRNAFQGTLLANRPGRKGQADAGVEEPVFLALKWLSRHQFEDGSWSAERSDAHCGTLPKYAGTSCSIKAGEAHWDGGVTGLALLAFLGAGFSHLSKETHDGICFGDVVRKGLQWMIAQQDPEGCVGFRTGHCNDR